MKISSEALKRDGKVLQLIHDLVVFQDVCNFNCNYCMTPSSSFHKEDGNTAKEFVWDLKKIPEMVYDADFAFKANIDKLLDAYDDNFNAPILKLSGGEVMLVKKLKDLLIKEASRYETVQILTNGSLFTNDSLTEFKKIPNLAVIMSIDGHTYEMNQYRTNSRSIHNKLMSNLDRLYKEGIPVEIYCVLNNQNTDCIENFADFLLSKYDGAIGLTPFPVRHHAAEKYGALPDQLNGLKVLIKNFNDYRLLLPPVEYLSDLHDFILTNTKRKIRCFTPFMMFQTFENGIVTPCPYAWFDKVGDLANNPREVLDNYGVTRTYDFLTTSPQRSPFCKTCFTDTHALALYCGGIVGLEDLIYSRPVLQRPKAKKRLTELKQIFNFHSPIDGN